MVRCDVTELEEVPVLCVIAKGGLLGVKEAWELLEAPLESLRGRRYYGTYSYVADEYRACFTLREDDPPFEGLESWVVPGGRYARWKLLEWRGDVSRIGREFDRMAHYLGEGDDPDRLSIEHYRSQRELVLYLPLR